MALSPKFLEVGDSNPLLCFSLGIELRSLFSVVYFIKYSRKYEIRVGLEKEREDRRPGPRYPTDLDVTVGNGDSAVLRTFSSHSEGLRVIPLWDLEEQVYQHCPGVRTLLH